MATFFVQSMTLPLETLISNSFYLTYVAGIAPSEVDNLTTYEFDKYIQLTSKYRETESERESHKMKSLSGLFSAFFGGKKRS